MFTIILWLIHDGKRPLSDACHRGIASDDLQSAGVADHGLCQINEIFA